MPASTPRLRFWTLAACLGLASAAFAQTSDPLKQAAAEKGAVVSDTGLIYLSMREGQGASPAATDTVKVHYRGTFTDGREFDSSYARGEPASKYPEALAALRRLAEGGEETRGAYRKGWR